MPATLEQAIAAARGNDAKNEWHNLEPSQQTSAIYREMRRIDLEEANAIAAAPQPPQLTVVRRNNDAVAQPRCCATLKNRKTDQCSWFATVKRGGAWYCGLHDPKGSPRAVRGSRDLVADRPEQLRVVSG